MNAWEMRELEWKRAFELHLTLDEAQKLLPVRVGADFGSQILCLSGAGDFLVPVSLTKAGSPLAVGDWLLLEPDSYGVVRRLQRESLLTRKAAGEKVQTQLIAANLDTLYVVIYCNYDFNPSRLERYRHNVSQKPRGFGGWPLTVLRSGIENFKIVDRAIDLDQYHPYLDHCYLASSVVGTFGNRFFHIACSAKRMTKLVAATVNLVFFGTQLSRPVR
jgi:hypothetical protein